MEHRWQVQRWDGEHAGDWVDAEPPVDKKVLDLAAQIIELEQRVKYEEEERGKFMDKAWKATGAKGDYPYGGVILMEIEGQAKERAAAMTEAEEATRMANQLHARVKELEAENLRLCTVIASDDSGTMITAEASTVLTLQRFQAMSPAEFQALYNAKWLTSGIHHDDFIRAPGKTAPSILNGLRERGLVEPNADRAGYWKLTEAGRLLMGEPVES